MCTFRICNILKRSAGHIYTYRGYGLYTPYPLKVMSKMHLGSSNALEGHIHIVPYGLGALQQQRYRSIRRSQVPYSNNYAFRYTTSADSKKNGPEVRVSLVENKSSRSVQIWRLGIVPSALLVLISVGLLLHYNDEKRAIPRASQGPSINMKVSKPTIGGNFELINYEEKPVTDRDFCGSWTVIYFGYTSSPDIDPVEVQKMAKVVEILETKENMKINAVFITIDPFRDTPSHLRAYLQEFHPRIMGLTGPENVLRQVAQEFRVFFKKTDVEGPDYLIDCSHNMYLMNPNMGFARMFGLEYNAEQLAYAISSEVKKISKAM